MPLGLRLERAGETESGCELVAKSPTGDRLFTVNPYCSSWQAGGKGSLRETLM